MTPPARRQPYKELGLPQLRSFCAVCRVGGYAPAARELLLTGPAVWEQIKALERHFKVELLERHGNRVRPTLYGEHLLELVRPILAGLESVNDALHQRDGVFPKRLTIVSNLRVLVEEISRAMYQFRERYPAVRLYIRYVSSEQVQPLVLDGSADITLTLEPGPDEPVSSAITYEPAGELDYLLVTARRHKLMRQKTLRLESIVDFPLVLAEPEAYSRQRIQEVFHRHDLTSDMKIAAETSSDEYTLVCVRAGLGVGIAVGNASSPLYRELSVRSLHRWFGTARVGFMWRRGAHVPSLQQELTQLLKSNLGKEVPNRSRQALR